MKQFNKEVGQKYVLLKDNNLQFKAGDIVTLIRISWDNISYYENKDGDKLYLYDIGHRYCEVRLATKEDLEKGETKMKNTKLDRNMKELYDLIEWVNFKEKKRTTVVKFKNGDTVKATCAKDDQFTEMGGVLACLFKYQFGTVKDMELFIKRKSLRK